MPSKNDDTILELQRNVVKLSETMGRVEGKVDTFIAQMRTQDDRATGLEVRTRKVEARQHWYAGAGSVIGALFGAFAPGFFRSHT